MSDSKSILALTKQVKAALKKVGKSNVDSDTLAEELIGLELQINKLKAADPSVSSLVENLAADVSAARKSMDAGEVVEKQKGCTNCEDNDCSGCCSTCGKTSCTCGCPDGKCTCKESKSKKDDDEEDEDEVEEELTTEEQEFLDSLVSMSESDELEVAMRQLNIVERLAEADRDSMALIVNSLKKKIATMADGDIVTEGTESLQNEVTMLREHNALLNQLITRYQGVVVAEEDEVSTVDLATTIQTHIDTNEDLQQWSEFLLESTDKEAFATRLQQIKNFTEADSSESISERIQAEHDTAKVAGASLAGRALKLMQKSNTTHINRGGEILEAKKNIR